MVRAESFEGKKGGTKLVRRINKPLFFSYHIQVYAQFLKFCYMTFKTVFERKEQDSFGQEPLVIKTVEWFQVTNHDKQKPTNYTLVFLRRASPSYFSQ